MRKSRTSPAAHKTPPAAPALKVQPPRKYSFRYAVGRRKTSVARVRGLESGSGSIIVNGLDSDKYFRRPELINIVRSPLKLAAEKAEYDFHIKVQGGGLHSQAEAVRHGLARLLISKSNLYRPDFKQAGWLRRDAREKERKKPGLRRARRAPQWQKR